MDEETRRLLAEQDAKLNAIYESVEKTRKYFLTTIIISVVVMVLPLIGLVFVLPTALDSMTGQYQNLGL
jgi:type IV secretory pathway component VirB8